MTRQYRVKLFLHETMPILKCMSNLSIKYKHVINKVPPDGMYPSYKRYNITYQKNWPYVAKPACGTSGNQLFL